MKKILIFLVLPFLFLACEDEPDEIVVQPDDKIDQYYKLVKINSNTDLEMATTSPDQVDSKVTFSCDTGEIQNVGGNLIYFAPSRPAKVKIKKSITNDEQEVIETTYSVLVYKQFIILKADDLMYSPGSIISDRWMRYINLVKTRNIKGSIGIVGVSIEQGNEQYLNSIKELHKSPNFEIWNHGYLHIVGAKNEDGEVYNEYENTSYEYQKEMFEHSQRLTREVLGFKMRTFGAPGNGIDQNTKRVIDEDDEVLVWFYGIPGTTKFLLERKLDIEYPYGFPSYDKFVAKYDPGVPMYVLQVHPNMWNTQQYEEFKRIIDFLAEQNVTYVNPYEYFKYSQKM